MFEVEAKVRLSKKDLARVLNEVKKKARLKEVCVQKDFYYGHEKAFYLRLRETNGKTVMALKSKKIVKGVETNREIEFPVTSRKEGHRLLTQLGFRVTSQKTKHSKIYTAPSVRFEFHRIPGLGDYLEIELLVKSAREIPKATQKLHALFRALGFSPDRFEKKYYLELLRERRKKT